MILVTWVQKGKTQTDRHAVGGFSGNEKNGIANQTKDEGQNINLWA